MSETIPQALADAVGRDPTAPLLTFYDDATGDRTELSGATVDNWVSKTANLLVDGAGLTRGDTAATLLPPHWQTAVILLGAWSAGLAVDLGGPPGPVDVLFTVAGNVPATADWSAPDRYATGLLPLAMPLREVPPGYADYVVEVRAFGDRFVPVTPVAPGDRACQGISHRDLCQAAADRAAEAGIRAGDRVLVDAQSRPDPTDWLLAPLVAGASVVLCVNLDAAALEERTAAEKISVVCR